MRRAHTCARAHTRTHARTLQSYHRLLNPPRHITLAQPQARQRAMQAKTQTTKTMSNVPPIQRVFSISASLCFLRTVLKLDNREAVNGVSALRVSWTETRLTVSRQFKWYSQQTRLAQINKICNFFNYLVALMLRIKIFWKNITRYIKFCSLVLSKVVL